VATVFGEEQVSIASIVQKSRGEVAEVIFVTHDAPERSVRRVLERLRELEVVKAVNSVIRVEATL
jgi:homoserine dehydrogenase